MTRENLLHGVHVTQKRLGGGAFGAVFFGTWHGCQVAVKKLHPTVMGIDDGRPTKASVRFIKELPILQQLSHPCIVQVFGMVPPPSDETSHGLVMELLPVTLRNRYEQEPQLTNDQEISIMTSLTSGLQYLHHKGILHRDLTTSNVMLAEKAGCESVPVRAKIIDAGLARVLNDLDGEEMTLAPGAVRFMAPEARSESRPMKAKYGRPSDIYGLGVTVMAMCIRREPPSIFDLAAKGRKGDLVLMKGLRHPLYDVVCKCVEEDSSVRPTCLQLCEELAKLQVRYPTAVVPQRSGDVTVSDGSVTADSDEVVSLRAKLEAVIMERDALRQEVARLTEDVRSAISDKDAALKKNEKACRNCAGSADERDEYIFEQHNAVKDIHRQAREVHEAEKEEDDTTRMGYIELPNGRIGVAVPHDQPAVPRIQPGLQKARIKQMLSRRLCTSRSQTRERRRSSSDSSLAGLLYRDDIQQVVRDCQLKSDLFPPGHPLRDCGALARSRRLLAENEVLPPAGKSPGVSVYAVFLFLMIPILDI